MIDKIEEEKHSELFEINIINNEEKTKVKSTKKNIVNSIVCTTRFISIMTLPTLMVVLVFMAYFHLIPLQMEWYSLIIIVFIWVVFLLFSKHNASISLCRLAKKTDSLEKDLEQYISKNNISLMGETKAIGSVDVFFDNLYDDLRNDNYAAVAASVFPTLGILGTFISIALSMPDFHSSNTSDALNSEITKLLGGVGTAFYASIYGIGLSLWWTLFEKRGYSSLERTLHTLRNKWEQYLWTDDEIKRATFIEQQSLNNEMQSTIQQTMTPEFVTKLNETITSQSDMLIATLEADKALHEELRETYKDIVTNFGDLIEKQSVLSSKIDESLEKSDQSYEKLSDNVSKLDDLSGQFKSYNDSIIEFYDAIGKQNDASREIAETLEGVVNSVNGQTQEMSNALVGITTDLVNSQSSMGSLVTTLGEMSGSVQNLVKDLNDAYADTVQKQMESFNQSITALGKQNQELTERSEYILSSFEKSAQGIEQGGSQIITAIKALNLDTIGSSIEVMAQTLQTSEVSMLSISEALGKQNQELSEHSEKVLKSFERSAQDIKEGGNQIITAIKASNLDNIGTNFEAMSHSLNTSVVSMQSISEAFQKEKQELSEHSQEVLQSFEKSAHGIERGGRQIIDAIKALNLDTIGSSIAVMSDTLKALEGSMQSTSSSMNNTIEKFDEDFAEKIRYTFKVLDEEIGTILSKVGSATKALKDTSENIEDNLDNYNSELLERLDQILSLPESKKEDK